MPTTVTKTIGTGGDYSTPQAWEDACPADLVTADQIWRGACLNQEFVATAAFTPIVTIGGQTTDATRYVELTAHTGASFADHADKLTNPLRYDATKGAALRITGNYTGVVNITTHYTRVSRLQINNGSFNSTVSASDYTTGVQVDQCILVMSNNSSQGITRLSADSVLRNCLLIVNASSPGTTYGAWWVFPGSNSKMLNCTVVRPSDVTASGFGFTTNYGSVLVQNTAIFGFASIPGSFNASSNNNASDLTLGTGANNQSGKTFTSQFENTLRATQDFRVKAGADILNTGMDLSASGITTDIVGVSRSVPYDIGAWEVASTSASLSANSIATDSPTVGTPTIGQTHGLSASNVVSGAPVVGTPGVGQTHGLTASDTVGSAGVVGSPNVGQTHVLSASNIDAGAGVVGTPSMTGSASLSASDTVASAPLVGSPAVGQTHALTASSIAGGTPVVGNPSLTETGHNLLATGIVGGAPVVGSPAISQTQVLGAASITGGAPVIGNTTFAQIHAFLASALVGGAFEFTAPLLNRVINLPPAERVGIVASQSRTIAVAADAREAAVSAESRNTAVDAVN